MGFRPGSSTQDQIARLLAIMEKAVDREKARRVAKINPQDTDKTFVCLIDLKLAFDKVDRDILI